MPLRRSPRWLRRCAFAPFATATGRLRSGSQLLLLPLAGALGVALTDKLCQLEALERGNLNLIDDRVFAALGVDVASLAAGWLARRPNGRALAVTPASHAGIRRRFGLDASTLET